MNPNHYETTESVTAGHPDKLCDQIADRILDACLEQDPDSYVAVEVLATYGKIVVAGEITTQADINTRDLVRKTVSEAGYDPSHFRTHIWLHGQSPDIAAVVAQEQTEEDQTGAGDQGIVYGYATDETDLYLPLAFVLAKRITQELTLVRQEGRVQGLGPDGKAQVTLKYEEGQQPEITTIVVSAQHDADIDQEIFEQAIVRDVLHTALIDHPWSEETDILINPSGRFVLGGPEADTGVTGRKLMVDTYGGLSRHGGGAFSGKDPSKVDRSGAYYARYVAKHLVAAGLAQRYEVSVSYAIGKSEPLMVNIDSFGTGVFSDETLREGVLQSFDFQPASMIRELALKAPVYASACRDGHFMDPQSAWEQLDRIDELRKAVCFVEYSKH